MAFKGNVQAKGSAIGQYRESEIPAWIMVNGERIPFDRVAAESSRGQVDLSQVAAMEYLIAPGLIYKQPT